MLVLQDDVKDVQREVEILNLVSDHPNVAELVNCFEDAHYVHLVGPSLPACCSSLLALLLLPSMTVLMKLLIGSAGA